MGGGLATAGWGDAFVDVKGAARVRFGSGLSLLFSAEKGATWHVCGTSFLDGNQLRRDADAIAFFGPSRLVSKKLIYFFKKMSAMLLFDQDGRPVGLRFCWCLTLHCPPRWPPSVGEML